MLEGLRDTEPWLGNHLLDLPRLTGSLCYPKSRSQARRRVCGVAAPDSVTPGGRGRAVNRKWARAVSRPQVGSWELRSPEGCVSRQGRPREVWQVTFCIRGLYLGLCRLLRDGCVVPRPHPRRSGDPKSVRSPECLKNGAETVAEILFSQISLECGRLT